MTKPSILIAPVGSKPQLVTIALDLLRQRGESVREVVVLHTTLDQQANRASIVRLGKEFPRAYPGIRLRPICLCDERGIPLHDVDSEPAAREAFRVLYREIKAAKQTSRRVHLSIAGGRKIIAVYGMTAAQLLFDSDDRVWHISSATALVASKALHPTPGEAALIRVPVLRWSDISPSLTDLILSDDPFDALERQEELLRADALRLARVFVEQFLTPAEREVVKLVVFEGLTDTQIADRTCRSAKTVGHHLSSAYRKARATFELRRADRHTLTSLLSIYYTLNG
ncbi:MAG: CRISPR-associated ring nuclease [Chloroflexota bacterium]|nr:CRISPR-associated ring nuclease [Chloroflexota bacterium]